MKTTADREPIELLFRGRIIQLRSEEIFGSMRCEHEQGISRKIPFVHRNGTGLQCGLFNGHVSNLLPFPRSHISSPSFRRNTDKAMSVFYHSALQLHPKPIDGS